MSRCDPSRVWNGRETTVKRRSPQQAEQIASLESAVPTHRARPRDRLRGLARLLCGLIWLAVGLLKLVPLAVGRSESFGLSHAAGLLEVALGACLVLHVRPLMVAYASMLVGTGFFVVSIIWPSIGLLVRQDCGCLGPWVSVDAAGRRALASVIIALSLVAITGLAEHRDARH